MKALSPRLRHAGLGVTFLVVVVVLCALAVAQFNRAFSSTFPVAVKSARAGLLMDPGSAVKMRGVVVGHVSSIHPDGDAALLDLDLDPDYTKRIPSNVGVRIVPPTVFGEKYVDLVPPTVASAQPVARNQVLSGATVTVEINDTFQHLVTILKAASPEQLNNALTALATAVDGRGAELGSFITYLDTYLKQINPSLDVLHTDLRKASPVLQNYAALAPNLLATARNISRTSDTLVAKRASLDAFLISFSSLADNTTTFLGDNEKGLVTTLDVLRPTTALLAKYSGELPCLLGGLTVDNKLLEHAIGGDVNGIQVFAGLLPTQKPYSYPKDLPIVGANAAPNCYGLPNLPVNYAPPHYAFNVGPNPYTGADAKPGFNSGNLAETLFGTLSGLVTP